MVMNLLMLFLASDTSLFLLIPEPALLRTRTTSGPRGDTDDDLDDDDEVSVFFSTHWFQYLRAMGLAALSTASGLGVCGGGVGDLTLVGVGH